MSNILQISGERYVYKFVCDPDALFQMALAENHRTALKMEANCIAAANAGSPTDRGIGDTNDYSGFSAAAAAAAESANRCGRHQYSDMLNQVYTSHLHAQLNQPQNGQTGQNTQNSQNHAKHQMFQQQPQQSQNFMGTEDYTHLHQFESLAVHGKYYTRDKDK